MGEQPTCQSHGYHVFGFESDWFGAKSREFENVIMAGVTFDAASFSGVMFKTDILRGVGFPNASFRDCSIVDTDLSHADFSGATFESCQFDDVLLYGSKLGDASFINETIPAGGKGIDISNANLCDDDYGGACLVIKGGNVASHLYFEKYPPEGLEKFEAQSGVVPIDCTSFKRGDKCDALGAILDD